MRTTMFEVLEGIHERPEPFQCDTAKDLWTDAHTSARMLAFHLDGRTDVASRNTAFIDRSVAWIWSRFNLGKGAAIADFGCGPGLYAIRFATRGARVTGIDFSQRSIAYAKAMADRDRLRIHYVEADYLDFETEDRFDLVLMIMCDFCALSPAQRKRLLHGFYRMLKPGGSLLLDVYSLAAFAQRKEATTHEANLLDGFWSPGKYYGFLNTFKYDREKVVLDKYTIVEPGRVRTIYNWFQHFTPQQMERELAAAGFRVEGLHADVAGAPYDGKAHEFAVIASRTSTGAEQTTDAQGGSPFQSAPGESTQRRSSGR